MRSRLFGVQWLGRACAIGTAALILVGPSADALARQQRVAELLAQAQALLRQGRTEAALDVLPSNRFLICLTTSRVSMVDCRSARLLLESLGWWRSWGSPGERPGG